MTGGVAFRRFAFDGLAPWVFVALLLVTFLFFLFGVTVFAVVFFLVVVTFALRFLLVPLLIIDRPALPAV